MTGTESTHTPPSPAFDHDVDPLPFAEGTRWRRAGYTPHVQRVLRAGRLTWQEFTPTASEFAVVALGIEDDRPADSVLQDEISLQFWGAALGIGLPVREALPDLRFVYAFMKGVLRDSR